MSRRESAYGRWARWVLGHRALVWIVTIAISVAAGLIGLPPKIDSNLLNLLPESEPSVAALKRINDEEGGLNLLSLTYRADDPEVLDGFLDDLQQRFEAMDDVAFAMHDLDPDLAKQVGLLQFDARDLEDLNNRLQGALALGPALNPVVTQRLMDMGPLTEKIAKSSDVALFQQQQPDRGRLIVRPTTTSADPVFAAQFMEKVDALLEEVDAEGRGIELLWMGGAYRHNVEDVEGIRSDLVVTGVAAALLVLLIMGVSFRSLRALVVVFPPLIVSNLVTLAFAALWIGALNTYTSFSTAILFGLGIDFAVHLVGRYRELVSKGMEQEEAIIRAWSRTGPPCATAALTSAAGFMAMATARFAGFAQLGVLLAFGLMMSLFAMLTILPLLIVLIDRGTEPLLGTTTGPADSRSSYAWSPPGVGLMIVLTTVIGVFAVPRLAYEYDVSALRRDGMSYSELNETERRLARESYSPVVVFFDDEPDELPKQQDRIEQLIANDGMPHVSAAVSIVNVLPVDQARRNEQIEQLVSFLDHKNLRYLPPVLVKRLLPLRGLEVRELTRDDLPEAVLLLLGANNEDSPRMLLLPRGNMWDVRESQALADEIERVLPDNQVAGEYIGVASMFLLAFEDAPRVAGIALILVALLAWWDLKKPLFVAGALGTLITGMVWAGGALWLFGVKLTMVNLSGIPILLGIGVDVVIHLLHRLEEEGPGGVRRALKTTGVAAGISTITTIGSFAALMFAGNRGVRSLGLLVVIGLVVIFMVSAFLLPLVWSAGWRLAGLAPSDTNLDPDELAEED